MDQKQIDKKDLTIKNRWFRELAEIVELHPNYEIAEHLYQLLIKKAKGKDPKGKDEFFYWDNEKLLKNTESYRYELEEEIVEDLAAKADIN